MPLKALYGVAGLGPAQLARFLTNVTGGCALILDNKVHKTGPLPVCPTVVFSSLQQFLKHHQRVTKDHIAFVIDAPEHLQAVEGLLGLGYIKLRSGHYAYTNLQERELLTCLQDARSTEEVRWSYKPVNFMETIVQDYKTDDVINKLRSLMYAVPNKEVRAEVITAIFKYLIGQTPLSKVKSVAGRSLGYKTCSRIQKLLLSGNGKELRIAYSKFKARPSKAERICKAHKVSMFTLRYLEAKAKQ